VQVMELGFIVPPPLFISDRELARARISSLTRKRLVRRSFRLVATRRRNVVYETNDVLRIEVSVSFLLFGTLFPNS